MDSNNILIAEVIQETNLTAMSRTSIHNHVIVRLDKELVAIGVGVAFLYVLIIKRAPGSVTQI